MSRLVGANKFGPFQNSEQMHYVPAHQMARPYPSLHPASSYMPYQDRGRLPRELQYFPVAGAHFRADSYWPPSPQEAFLYDYNSAMPRLSVYGNSPSPNYVYTSPHQPLRPIIYKAGQGMSEPGWLPPMQYPRPATPLPPAVRSVAPAPFRSGVSSSEALSSRGRGWGRKKQTLTYSQCEILNAAETPSPPRQASLQPSLRDASAAEMRRSASVSGAHRAVRLPVSAAQPFEPVSPPSETASPSPGMSRLLAAGGLEGVSSLEELKALNEKNLALARNTHVREIWKGLQDGVSVSGGGDAVSGGKMQIADLDKARETLQQLNPEIRNSEALMQLLMDHIQGRPPQISPETLQELAGLPNTRQVLMPVRTSPSPSASPSPSVQGGFKVSHAFAMKLKQGEEREFAAVKVIESPEVLAVFNLLTETETADLVRRCQQQGFAPCKTSAMKIKIDDKCSSYSVPNDLEDLPGAPLLDSAELNRHASVCVLNLTELENDPDWSFLKSVALRAAAVAKVPATRINSFYVERYDPGQIALGLHPSNKRLGFVYICLSTVTQENGCGLSFPAAEIELTPRSGMAIFIPGCHEDTVPTHPGYTGEHQYVPDVRTEFCVTQNETADKSVYFAVVPISF